MEYPSLSLLMRFCLKTVLSDSRTLASWFHLFENSFCYAFTLRWYLFYLDGVFLEDRTKMDHVSLYPFTGKLRPLILRVVVEQCLLILVLLLWYCFLRLLSTGASLGVFSLPFTPRYSLHYPLQSWFSGCKCLKSVFIVKFLFLP